MTGYINHDVDVQDDKTIVWIREESDYGKCFLCIKSFIVMFERGFHGSELAKKNIYWPTEIYGYGINANCKINKQVIMNTSKQIEGASNYNIIMMSTYYGLVVCEFQKKEYRMQKVRFKHYSMHNPFIVTSCLEELWIIKISCAMIAEQNIRLDYRMFRLPTGGKSESLHFYSMRRCRLLIVVHIFSKEGQIIQVF